MHERSLNSARVANKSLPSIIFPKIHTRTHTYIYIVVLTIETMMRVAFEEIGGYFFASDSIDDSRDPVSKAGLSIKGQLRSRVIKTRWISCGSRLVAISRMLGAWFGYGATSRPTVLSFQLLFN